MANVNNSLYWLETWNVQISTIVGALASLCGFFALLADGASCKLAGLLQIITGLIVVAIEGPNFLPQLAFAAQAGAYFEGKPAWIKVAVYGVLTIVPAFAGCLKGFILGFILSAMVTALHALLLLRGRQTTDEMNFDNNGVQVDQQGYSPASP